MTPQMRDSKGATGGWSASAILVADTRKTLADKLPVAPITRPVTTHEVLPSFCVGQEADSSGCPTPYPWKNVEACISRVSSAALAASLTHATLLGCANPCHPAAPAGAAT